MPLPAKNDLMKAPGASNPPLGNALATHPPVTGDNAVFTAKHGNAVWSGKTFVVSGEGLVNYWYLPAVQDKVSYCVVHGNGAGDAYVISDQFGGCEYHQLYHKEMNLVAFLHVYRGTSGPATYTVAAGWELQGKKFSNGIAKQNRHDGEHLGVFANREEHQAANRPKQVHRSQRFGASAYGFRGGRGHIRIVVLTES